VHTHTHTHTHIHQELQQYNKSPDNDINSVLKNKYFFHHDSQKKNKYLKIQFLPHRKYKGKVHPRIGHEGLEGE